MAKIQGKWIEDGAVGADQIQLGNDAFLKGRNNADNADVDIIKVNTSDQLELSAKLRDADNSAPSADEELANKKYVDDQVAGITIPSTFELQGNWDADTNSPTLANTDTSVDNFLYYVNVAGSTDFGAGSITFAVGDWVYNNGSVWLKADNNDDVLSVNGQVGVVVLDTDDISEGATNKYVSAAQKTLIDNSIQPGDNVSELTNDSAFVDAAGARTAAVVNSTAGSETDQAPSVASIKAYVDSNSGETIASELVVLSGADISNGYKDLGLEAKAGSLRVLPTGAPEQVEGSDYTLSVPAAVTRVTFAGDLLANATAGDQIWFRYFQA